ncbi:hypothetical protein Ade02nite_69410 [Paractinoplanes deccanensis]|uniref:SGNH/GDSL hydrolase family protein n=1 Tax=Paractinoplanes deccanensis TaxID=113561 RepID=A0ABQ3YET4_9ACTN|nr:hypothetical protein Ade02nite_69410 [Actinoplanes deccanensis]
MGVWVTLAMGDSISSVGAHAIAPLTARYPRGRIDLLTPSSHVRVVYGETVGGAVV